jgi:putative transposase
LKKSRFSEEKIIAVLKQAEAGVKLAELVRKHGVSEATLYNWKARYGGMDVSQLRRLKELEAENGRLKCMYADLSLTRRRRSFSRDRISMPFELVLPKPLESHSTGTFANLNRRLTWLSVNPERFAAGAGE